MSPANLDILYYTSLLRLEYCLSRMPKTKKLCDVAHLIS